MKRLPNDWQFKPQIEPSQKIIHKDEIGLSLVVHVDVKAAGADLGDSSGP